MKYKEFEKELAELDLFVEYTEVKQIVIYISRKVSLAIIDDNVQYGLLLTGKCRLLSPEVREKFFGLAVEYASTPIEKRKPEPKDKQPVICLCREDVEDVIATTWKHEKEEDIMIDVYEQDDNAAFYLKERWPYETFKKAKKRPDNRLLYIKDDKARNIFY